MMLREFKKFISRGNVLDMAVGVIVGGAFGKIVTSLVNDILMPILGFFIGGVDFTYLEFKGIKYGNFLQNILDFLIVAFCIFLVVKTFNKFNEFIKKEEEKRNKKEENAAEAKEEVKESEEVLLLREISKQLKSINKKTNK